MKKRHSSIILGIPVINRIDLLYQSLEQVLKHDVDILIISNSSNGAFNAELTSFCKENSITLLLNERNIGVAAAWNRIIEYGIGHGYRHVLIGSNDIVLGSETVPAILDISNENRKGATIYHFEGWNLFMTNKAVVEQIGPFDENFFPAYFEDIDYSYRCDKLNQVVKRIFINAESENNYKDFYNQSQYVLNEKIETTHLGSQSRKYSLFFNLYIKIFYRINRLYYRKKWGGDMGNEKYKCPFNRLEEVSYSFKNGYSKNVFIRFCQILFLSK